MQNYDEVSEACLNRNILNNSVKRKAMEDLCERPRKLIHKKQQTHDSDTLIYKDIRNINKNFHTARFFHLLPPPTDIEENHEALSAVQVLTCSKEQFLLLMTRKKYCNVFLQNQLKVSLLR
jgi:hypothetical protein